MQKVSDIRKQLVEKYQQQDFVIDKTGVKMVELIGATFLADEVSIFGEVNWDYVERELGWYKSMSLNVNDIPGGPPPIWKQVSGNTTGEINSNYGWAIWSDANYNQYDHVLNELKTNPFSRRAEMIYTRPSMWLDYKRDGMSDFMCTDSVSYFIREDKLTAHVKMRSNDGVLGYRNDRAWQYHVLELLAGDLGVQTGDIVWTASSLHIYQRHLNLIEAAI